MFHVKNKVKKETGCRKCTPRLLENGGKEGRRMAYRASPQYATAPPAPKGATILIRLPWGELTKSGYILHHPRKLCKGLDYLIILIVPLGKL